MVHLGVQLVFGGGSFMDENNYSPENIEKAFKLLQSGGVTRIDTARIYGPSEDRLGKAKASLLFTIDTKYPGGFSPELSTKNTVISSGEESLQNLQTDQMDVYYIHAPARDSSLEDVLAGINALYEAGKFKRFGLSNFLASEVEEVIRVAREKGYILPSVYQGNYSAISRKVETEIIPILRENKISFHAYSPVAGGFLTKDIDKLVAGDKGRWDPSTALGSLYHALYNKPGMLNGLQQWENVSRETGIAKAELAYRWITYHSSLDGELGDAVVFGSRNIEQMKETLGWLKTGPLNHHAVHQVEQIWKLVEEDSPLDNFNSSFVQQQKWSLN